MAKVISLNDKRAEKELTQEERRALNVKLTLESKVIQGVFAGNELKSNPHDYGTFGYSKGQQIYDGAVNSKEVAEMRESLYAERKKEKDSLGIAEEVPLPTNYEVVASLIRQLREVQAIAKVGELEEYAKANGALLDFKIADGLKDYSQADLIQKAVNSEGKIDIEKLSDIEKHALQMHQVLTGAYGRALCVNAAADGYFSDINAQGKQIAEGYEKLINPEPRAVDGYEERAAA